MQKKPLKLVTIIAAGSLLFTASPAFASESEAYNLDDLPNVESKPGVEQTLVLSDGRDFAIPEPGMEVSYEAIVAEGSPEVPKILLVADENGEVAVRIGDDAFGSTAGIEHLEVIEETFESDEAHTSLDEQLSQPDIQAAASPIKCTGLTP